MQPIETLSDLVQFGTLVDWLFVITLFGGPIYFLTIIFLQHILGYLLSKKYDPHFFKPPYFTLGEVAVYSSWPMSLMRYGTYIIFAGFPRILQKRRFKGHASPYTPGRLMKVCCQMWLIALVFGIIAAPTLFGLMFILPTN